MALNCKPGDLAVIVRDDYEVNIGKLVTVLRRSKWENTAGMVPGVQWECKPHSDVTADVLDQDGRFWDTQTDRQNVDMPDAWLRPIRDPGEDAKDETLLWLPVPEKVTA